MKREACLASSLAAAEVVEIVGECAHGVENGFRVPALLELQPLPLHGLSVEDVVNLDGQVHLGAKIRERVRRENEIVCSGFFPNGSWRLLTVLALRRFGL